MEKRVISLILTIAMIMTLVPAVVFAIEPTKYNDGGGDGTENNPWQISNTNQLKDLADAVNGTGEYATASSMSGVYFKLTADITSYSAESIGRYYNTTFNGNFDGDGHAVNIVMGSDQTHLGLFGYIDELGVVSNVKVTGSVTIATFEYNNPMYFGGICGYNAGCIYNCENNAEITCNRMSVPYGGICGYNKANIKSCKNTANINSSAFNGNFGGICGSNENGRIINCVNKGEIKGEVSSSKFAGICGNSIGGTIENCANLGKVTGGNDTGSFGGVCGYGDYGCKLINAYNRGIVLNEGNLKSFGAICGYKAETVTISDCYYIESDCESAVGNNVDGGIKLADNQMKADSGVTFSENTPGKALVDLLNEYIDNPDNSASTVDYAHWTKESGEYPYPAKADNYKITISSSNESFTVSVPSKYMEAEKTVTVAAIVDEYHAIQSLSYNDGTEHNLTADAQGEYSFIMPSKDVTISVTFKEIGGWRLLADALVSSTDFATENTVTDDDINYFTVHDVGGVRTIKLLHNIKATPDSTVLEISTGSIHLDLNGYTIDRGLNTPTKAFQGESKGHVLDIASGASLIIADTSNPSTGKITGGYSQDDCGGIYVKGTFVLSGGSVIGNEVSRFYGQGGGVYVADGGTFTMRGGSIKNNPVGANSFMIAGYGCGVYVEENGSFVMIGGEIADNTSSGWIVHYDAVYVSSGGSIVLGGDAKIKDNAPTNLYLEENAIIELGTKTDVNNGNGYAAPTDDMDIKVSSGIAQTVVSNWPSGVSLIKYFSKDNEEDLLKINITDNTLELHKKYSVSIASMTNGTVTASKTVGGSLITSSEKPYNGDSITLTVTPTSGYHLKENSLTVDNGTISINTINDNTYTFLMPAKDVSVKAVFEVDSEPLPPEPPVVEPIQFTSRHITVADTENGSISVNKKETIEYSTVTITVTPDTGYVLETLNVKGESGRNLSLKDIGDNKYSFNVTDGDSIVEATFMLDNSIVNYCVDVYADDYYYDAVIWAYKNGITEGKDELHFGPTDLAKRSDVVVMLWKAAGCPVVDYAINLDDVDEDAEYAEAVRWALSEKITFGTSETTFSPDEICNRAQMITLIARFAGVEDTETDSKFEDVKPAAYYAAAVKWAEENGVTEGTSETTFSPNLDCNNAQAVTFLYRWMVR